MGLRVGVAVQLRVILAPGIWHVVRRKFEPAGLEGRTKAPDDLGWMATTVSNGHADTFL